MADCVHDRNPSWRMEQFTEESVTEQWKLKRIIEWLSKDGHDEAWILKQRNAWADIFTPVYEAAKRVAGVDASHLTFEGFKSFKVLVQVGGFCGDDCCVMSTCVVMLVVYVCLYYGRATMILQSRNLICLKCILTLGAVCVCASWS